MAIMISFKLILCIICFIAIYPGVNCDIDCAKLNALINTKSEFNLSILVQSFYTAYESKGTSIPWYPFTWDKSLWDEWKKMLDTKWIRIIKNRFLPMEQRHAWLYQYSYLFFQDKMVNVNKSTVLCTPIQTKTKFYGYFGDYLKCNEYVVRYPLKCDDYFNKTSPPTWLIGKDGNTDISPKYCCDNRNTLINQTSPKHSEIIREVNRLISADGQDHWYRHKWSSQMKTQWATTQGNLELIIANSQLTNAKKHQQIYDTVITFITALAPSDRNKMFCVTLGEFGSYADYLKCQVTEGSALPAYALSCILGDGEVGGYSKKCSEYYCCSNRDPLFNAKSPNSSVLIQSYYNAFTSVGKDDFYHLIWNQELKAKWTAMMLNEWIPTIADANLKTNEKFLKIYDNTVKLLLTLNDTDKAIALCVPIENVGPSGNVFQCDLDQGAFDPGFKLRCETMFNSRPTWVSPSMLCDTACCGPASFVFNSTDAVLTQPFHKCQKFEYKCKNPNGLKACITISTTGASGVSTHEDCSRGEKVVNLTCFIGDYYYEQQGKVTAFSCTGAKPKPTPATDPAFKCCTSSALTVNQNKATFAKPTTACQPTNRYTCTADTAHSASIEITLANEASESLDSGSSDTVSVDLNCSNQEILYKGNKIASIDCTGTARKTTTTSTVAPFTCCKETDLTFTQDAAKLTKPDSYCKKDLQFTCLSGLTNDPSRNPPSCIIYTRMDSTVGSVCKGGDLTGAVLDLTCDNGVIKHGSQVKSILCKADVPATTLAPAKPPCCNFNQITKQHADVKRPTDPCTQTLTFQCINNKEISFKGDDEADLGGGSENTLNCLKGKIVDNLGRELREIDCE